ncbi:hypothetical protein CPB84DRAFT_1764065 [Gymnopilus junonius]|uniref:Secreted protein n=1 Tax=Gymnopilus junonius TaxID=109634 RepID=A0A9P5NZK4_GYMJU|nr:hypothetical protein CPB84DRAFT_1764065 [Gymnopilus junonius]
MFSDLVRLILAPWLVAGIPATFGIRKSVHQQFSAPDSLPSGWFTSSLFVLAFPDPCAYRKSRNNLLHLRAGYSNLRTAPKRPYNGYICILL